MREIEPPIDTKRGANPLAVLHILVLQLKIQALNLILLADLVNEFLFKILVKSFIKFKYVLKSWFGLISIPKFVKTHLSISSYNTGHRLMLGFDPPKNNLKDYSISSLLYDHVTEAIDLDCPMKKSYQFIRLVNTINNLIFLDIGKKDLFLWNPSIWKVKKLPSSKASFFYKYGFEYNEFH